MASRYRTQLEATQAQSAGTAPAAAGAKIWIGQTAQIEQGLKTAEIARIEDIGTGVTRPQCAYLKSEGLFESFTWKPLKPGVRRGYFESYKSEIAAYELDKLLDLNMVPPVAEREMDGEWGAAVMWFSLRLHRTTECVSSRFAAASLPDSHLDETAAVSACRRPRPGTSGQR